MQCWSLRFNRQKKRRLFQCHETDFDYQTLFQQTCRASSVENTRVVQGTISGRLEINRNDTLEDFVCQNQQTSTHSLLAWHIWVEIETVASVFLSPRVLRIIRIYAIVTKHGNEDWNQKSTHRGKLQIEQVNVEQRPGFLQHHKKVRQTYKSTPGISWQHRQRAGVCVQVTHCTSHNKENVEIVEGTAVLRRVSAVMSAVRSFPPRDRA